MNISDYRSIIDMIDGEIAALFIRRTQAVEAIGAIKKENGIAVTDENREKSIVERLVATYGEENRKHITVLFSAIFEYSKTLQK